MILFLGMIHHLGEWKNNKKYTTKENAEIASNLGIFMSYFIELNVIVASPLLKVIVSVSITPGYMDDNIMFPEPTPDFGDNAS